MSYSGHWRTDGEHFEATLVALGIRPVRARSGDEQPGRSRGGVTASCKGTAKQTPGLLEATLVRIMDS
jgi:hypothetical protein